MKKYHVTFRAKIEATTVYANNKRDAMIKAWENYNILYTTTLQPQEDNPVVIDEVREVYKINNEK